MSTGRKLSLALACVAIFALAFAVSCRGFFQNPTLTSITVGPTGQNVQVGSTLQMAARGTFDDGSTKIITGQATWASDDQTVATVNSGGLVSGVSAGTANISASLDALSNSASVTVVLTGVTAITIEPQNPPNLSPGGSQNFQVFATVTGQPKPVDVTSSVVWTLSDTSGHTNITSGVDPAVFSADSSTPAGPVTITATYTVGTTVFTNQVTITIQ